MAAVYLGGGWRESYNDWLAWFWTAIHSTAYRVGSCSPNMLQISWGKISNISTNVVFFRCTNLCISTPEEGYISQNIVLKFRNFAPRYLQQIQTTTPHYVLLNVSY